MLFERFVSAVGFSSVNSLPRQAPAVIPTSAFLRRAHHSSTVVNQWLYIDGGEFSFLNNGTPQYESLKSILSIDLSRNWVNSTVAIHSTTKPNGVPNFSYGSLSYDESTQLLYTGYPGDPSSLADNALPSASSIWTFKPDSLGGGTWNQIISSNASVWSDFIRSGRGYRAYGHGSAYVLGGLQFVSSGPACLPGMNEFNMSSQIFSTQPAESDPTSGNPCYGGTMQYVPIFGPAGVFVAMGGGGANNSTVNFGYVYVYDPASGSWYNQTTTGSKPVPRYDFCTAGAASTNSTYEIFVYSGNSGHLGTSSVPFDTINILTLPAFNWFSVAYNPQNPRSGHTCEAVGGSQIAIVGGCDSNPKVLTGDQIDLLKGTLSTPDPFAQGLAIFDLRTMDFAPEYIAGGGAVYEPNEIITQFYAQGSYNENLVEGVAQLMKETHLPPGTSSNSTAKFPPATSSNSTANNSTLTSPSAPQSSSNPHINHAGSIAGGIIGGFLGIAQIIVLVFWLLRRRRRKMQAQLSQPWAPEIDGNARAELQQRGSRLELGCGEAHEKDGNARAELGYGEAHEKDGNARAELPGQSTMY